jgi:hypothetical protein
MDEMSTTSPSMAMPTGMSMSTMMTFSNDNTMLKVFSANFSPKTTGQYVGAWFFAFCLALVWRALVHAIPRLDQYWVRKYASKSIVIKGGNEVLVGAQVVTAWRASVNIPRALLAFLAQAISYLL